MNTADIRRMDLSQWLFWASAIPFTLLVIMVTLYFVDVPPLWRWLERKRNEQTQSTRAPTQSARRNRANFLASLVRSSEDTLVASDDVDEKASDDEASTVYADEA